jgi:hypothetical protein
MSMVLTVALSERGEVTVKASGPITQSRTISVVCSNNRSEWLYRSANGAAIHLSTHTSRQSALRPVSDVRVTDHSCGEQPIDRQ